MRTTGYNTGLAAQLLRGGNIAAVGILMSICAKTNIWYFYEHLC